MKKVLVFLMTAIMACSMLLTGCGGEEKKAADSAKVLRVGTEPVFAPFEFPKEGSKDLTGFDIELIEALGKQMGYKVEMVSMGFDALIPALNSNNIDVAIAGMTITDEGKKAASITNAYAENAQVVVMKQSEVGKYKTTDDLKNLKSIAIEGGSAGEKAAQAAGLTNTVVSDSQALALTEVTSGSADACIIDLTMANAMTGEGTGNKNLTYSIKLEAEEYGIAFRKGSDMTAKTNELMAGMMKDGTLDKLAKKYQIVLIKDADNK